MRPERRLRPPFSVLLANSEFNDVASFSDCTQVAIDALHKRVAAVA